VLKEGDPVDLNGDGIVDPTKKLSDFTGISALTVSDRDNLGDVNIYFTADVDTAGTTSLTDDIEGFFKLKANAGPPVAVTLQSFEATAANGEVTLEWSTANEIEHLGFHVDRAETAEGPYTRLTGTLVTGRSPYRFVDATARAGATFYYRLGAVDRQGREEILGRVSVTTGGLATRTAVLPNLPNPFGAATDLRFVLARAGDTQLAVFDARGRLVRALGNGPRAAGTHSIRWDGRDDAGRPVAGGTYLFRLETGGRVETQKIVRLVGR
jgi:hypothetical protein